MSKRSTSENSPPKSEVTKQTLLEVSYRLFKERGYANVGVREIAAEAGMTTGAFYYYFRCKADILDHQMDQRGQWLMHQILPQLEEQVLSPVEKIRQLLGNHLCSVFIEEGWELCESRMFARYHSRRESVDLKPTFLHYCQQAQEQGLLSASSPPQQIVDDLVLVGHGVEYDWCRHQGSYDIRERMLYHIDNILLMYQAQ